jgi:AraC-like DNA-binding protein
MKAKDFLRVKTISEGHRLQSLPSPAHPLISIVDLKDIKPTPFSDVLVLMDFYIITLKKDGISMPYGQGEYRFENGSMAFILPNQILSGPLLEPAADREGWMMFIHPDFLWKTALGKRINQFEFFSYSSNEALILSEDEERIINEIVQNIRHEYHSKIDEFSQDIIISQVETLLNYADRFYQRQFVTQRLVNHQILTRVEFFLNEHYKGDSLKKKGLPTVTEISDFLQLSPAYLSSLLKHTTGLTAQQHIHDKIVLVAKEKLSSSSLTVSEIAYDLGFEHVQSFSKLFKKRTNLSPVEFRQSFR